MTAEKSAAKERTDALIASLKNQLAESKAREAELVSENMLLKQLYEKAPLSYQSLDENGNFLSVNQAWLNSLGYRAEEVIGRNFGDFLHPDWADHFKENFPRFKAVGEILGVEFLMRKKDGNSIFVSFHGKIGRDHQGNFQQTYCMFQDVTWQKMAEEALIRSEARWRNIIVSIQLIGISLNPKGQIVFANEYFLKLVGWTEQEVFGQDWFLMFIPENIRDSMRHVFFTTMAAKDTTDYSTYENEIITKTGELRNIAWSNVLNKDINDNIMDVTCMGVDLTERQKFEKQIIAINAELERKVEQRTRELQEKQLQYLHAEKLSAVGKLSASIAHEFNNPLQSVLTVLKGFKITVKLEEQERKLLDAAIGESERMRDLIRTLQLFNRPSLGKKVFMDVNGCVDSLIFLSKSDFKRKGIAIVLNYAEQMPVISAVPDQIKQVFLNLLSNAADACSPVGGAITISTRREGEKIAVAIKDNGVGIKPEHIEMIFQPFFTTKPVVKGTGLGLSVCHGIVESHNGTILVESRPGEGATFTVLLPIKGE